VELRLDFRHRRALSKSKGGTETGPLLCGKVPVGLGILRHQDAPLVRSDGHLVHPSVSTSGGTEYVTPAASLHVTLSQSLTEQKPPGLSRDRQGLEAHLFCFLYSSQGPSTRLSSPPMADSWPFKFASGGACTYAKPLKHAQRLRLLGRPVFGLVDVQFGWECSPTTLVA
jgi:hypothetical protein